MRVLTWLPRDIRAGLEEIDPVHRREDADRPPLEAIMERAQLSDAGGVPVRRIGAGDEIVGSLVAGKTHDRRTPFAVVCSLVAIGGLTAGIALTVGQGGTSPAGPRSGLFNVTWLDPETQATVVFRPGTAHLSDGCSGVTRRLTVHGNRLHLGHQVGKSYVCSPPGGPQPGSAYYREYRRQQRELDRFYRVLSSSPRWAVAGTALRLTSADGTVLRLTSRGTAPLTLPGSQWALDEVSAAGTGAVSGGYGGTLTFDTHGRFTADEPCVALSGTARISDRRVAFHVTRQIPKRCPPTIGSEMTPTIHKVLSTTAFWQVEDNRLRLWTSDRTELYYRPRG